MTWQEQLNDEQYHHRRLPKVDNSDGPSTRWARALLAESTADVIELSTPVQDKQRAAS